MSNTANRAIMAEMGQTQAVRDAKRELFEAAAYEHYQERHKASGADGQLLQEEFCRRLEDGRYFYTELNTAWWGFQAGFVTAALAGAAAPSK